MTESTLPSASHSRSNHIGELFEQECREHFRSEGYKIIGKQPKKLHNNKGCDILARSKTGIETWIECKCHGGGKKRGGLDDGDTVEQLTGQLHNLNRGNPRRAADHPDRVEIIIVGNLIPTGTPREWLEQLLADGLCDQVIILDKGTNYLMTRLSDNSSFYRPSSCDGQTALAI